MSRIKEALKNKKSFIGFLTAGDPSLDKTEEFIVEMANAGAGLIEIGIPFSDPIAEGPVIQAANIRALSVSGGCTTDMIFEIVVYIQSKTTACKNFFLFDGLNRILRISSDIRLDPRQYFCDRKWLRNIIVRAQPQTQSLIGIGILRGQNDDGYCTFLSDLLHDLHTAFFRYHQIKQNQTVFLREKFKTGALSVKSLYYFKVLCQEKIFQHITDLGIIFY